MNYVKFAVPVVHFRGFTVIGRYFGLFPAFDGMDTVDCLARAFFIYFVLFKKVKSSSLVSFLRDYFRRALHYSYSDEELDVYSYSSDNGKKGLNVVAVLEAADRLTDRQFKLLLMVVMGTPVGRNPLDSGVVWLHERDYEGYGRQYFNEAVRRFVELGFLVPTCERRWYVVNPKYVNSYYRVKVKRKKGGGS